LRFHLNRSIIIKLFTNKTLTLIDRKTMKFKINTPNIVHELIDDEVIIVNLKKGDYYSLLSASAEIWIEIERGQSSAQIVAQLTQNYQEESEIIAQGVQFFIEQLIEEGIVTELAGDIQENGIVSHALSNNGIDKPPFEMPKLSKFTDMEDLLALDPIHEVDETGWPNAKLEGMF